MIEPLFPYLEYKDSGQQCFGQIPKHWKVLKNGQIFSQRNQTGFPHLPILEVSLKTGVRVRDFENSKRKQVMSDREKYKRVDKGDIAYNMMRMWQGAVGVAPVEGLISPAYVVASPLSEVESRYYSYLFRTHTYMNEVNKYSRGIVADRNRLYWDEFKQIPSLFPPSNEQKKIADFLDDHGRKVSRLVWNKRRQIELLRELKQAMISSAVTRGVNSEVQLKSSGVDWLGDIPEHWDVRYLFQIATEQFISNKEVHHQNLLSLSYGKIIQKDINKTDGLLPASFDTYQIVNNGNIILRLTDLQNDRKSLRVGLVTQTGIITSAYTCLKAEETILSEYLYLLLHSFDTCKVFYGMGSGVRQSIGYADIKKLRVMVPNINEQREIVDFCYDIINKTEFLVTTIEKEINLISEYRISLISDVVTGKVDVRGIEVDQLVEEDSEIGEIDQYGLDNEEELDLEECEV